MSFDQPTTVLTINMRNFAALGFALQILEHVNTFQRYRVNSRQAINHHW